MRCCTTPDILPVILAAIECPTPSIVDAALRTLPSVLPVLDFSTIKNELFPVVAAVFSKTNSLAIKVRGLQAFVILCGGSTDAAADDGLNGLVENKKKTSSSSALDKYTMQEKIVPLLRGIKTKEPAVMMAALNVLRIVGENADADFVAMDILPILWNMSLGPLLDLRQFQTFMALIRNLSKRVEDEQTKKLQELAGTSNAGTAGPNEDFLAFGGVTGTTFDGSTGGNEDDFEALVKGKGGAALSPSSTSNNGFPSWDEAPSIMSSATATAKSASSTPRAPSFSWSSAQTPTSPTTSSQSTAMGINNSQPGYRTVTPDLARFGTLAPSSTQYSQPLQPSQPSKPAFQPPPQQTSSSSSINSSNAAAPSNPWASSTPNYSNLGGHGSTQQPVSASMSMGGMNSSMSGMSLGSGDSRNSSFSLPPPPGSRSSPNTSFSIKPPPAQSSWGTASQKPMGSTNNASQQSSGGAGGQKSSGLDKYESLI
jgi:SCY1-like protein 2